MAESDSGIGVLAAGDREFLGTIRVIGLTKKWLCTGQGLMGSGRKLCHDVAGSDHVRIVVFACR